MLSQQQKTAFRAGKVVATFLTCFVGSPTSDAVTGRLKMREWKIREFITQHRIDRTAGLESARQASGDSQNSY